MHGHGFLEATDKAQYGTEQALRRESALLCHHLGGRLDISTAAVHRPKPVLLVEDSPGDARLTEEAFREINTGVKLYRVEDGVEAMAFLRKVGQPEGAARPESSE